MRRSAFSGLVLVAAVLVGASRAQAQAPYQVLHSFDASPPSGPEGTLVVGSDNALYGTTTVGGASGSGTVFKINADGSGYTTLHDFDGTNGAYPYTELLDLGGVLYGTTYQGGTSKVGVVFSVHEDGSAFTVLYTFSGPDGAYPFARLLDLGGVLYGTAYQGGAYGYGTAFVINADGSGFTKLHDFDSTNGGYPTAGLVASGGVLYGTTYQGGPSNDGTVFSISTDGSAFTVLYSFSGPDGANPYAGLIDSGGVLYGTTYLGGAYGYGTVFSINMDGSSFTKLHDFDFTNGANPYAELVASGSVLFGTTYQGGASKVGTVFSIDANRIFTKLYDFDGADGNGPVAGLLDVGGVLYGTAFQGGLANAGTIFSIHEDGSGFTKLHDAWVTNGGYPYRGLVDVGGVLYGTTYQGGVSNTGTIFKVNEDGSAFTKLHDFDYANGAYPYAGLVDSGGVLYGTTAFGGSQGKGYGTIFKIREDGSGFAKLHDFDGADGAYPYAGLVDMGGVLYGTTYQGGASNVGTVFEIREDGSSFAKLHDFDGANGAWPSGGLVNSGRVLYGTTSQGGASANNGAFGYGTVFKMNADGSGFAKLHDFDYANGGYPFAGLVDSGSVLYGTTNQGGLSGGGTVFKINEDGSGFAKLHDFDNTNGAFPYAGLVDSGGVLYGTTLGASGYGYGTVFQIIENGSAFTKLHDFDNTDGAFPYAGLAVSGGVLYGTTYRGGSLGGGVVFSLVPPSTPSADLAVAKSGPATAIPGQAVTYAIVVSNNGPIDAPGAAVTDVPPPQLSGVTWTCVASGGSSCTGSGSGSIADTVNLVNGGAATYTLTGTVSPGFIGTLTNTATVVSPAGIADPVPTNNSSSSTTAVAQLVPVVTWASPAPIAYGTALDVTQLNATANVPGTFVYTPPAGTVLPAGLGQTLLVAFTPTDSVTYSMVTATVTIDVTAVGSTTSLVTSRSPEVSTRPVALTATVVSSGGTPTGNVQFFDGGTLLGTAPLTGSGPFTAAFATVGLTVAGSPHAVTAQYLGDANVTGSTSAAVSQTVTPGSYSVTDLGSLGGGQTFASAINNTGQVVGSSWLSGNAAQHAFLYSGGTTADLGTLGGTYSYPSAINGGGQVVGYSTQSGDTAQHAFLYSGGTMADLGTLGGTYSNASAINSAGQVVGYSYLSGNTAQHAFFYSGGTMADLGTLGGTYSYPSAINGGGQIVGYSTPSGDTTQHAFLYSGGTMADLGTLGGTYSYASAINGAGQVVGYSYQSGNAAQHAFLYSGGTMVDLGTLGGTYSNATAINGAGQVTGQASLSDGTQHAFLYSGGAMTDVGTLGGTYSSATAINTAGQVVGWSSVSGGALHVFLYGAGTMTDLDEFLPGPFAVSVGAAGSPSNPPVLNDVGQAVVNGTTDNGRTIHAFLLTPAAVTSLAVPSASGFPNGSVTLSATLTSSGTPLVGETFSFTLNGVAVGSGLTNAAGVATVNASLAGFSAGTYPGAIQARFLGDATYATSFGSADLTVTPPLPPAITWANPAPITYGTALDATQLNATANVPGTLFYTPPAGTVLSAGASQLSVTFTPTDNVTYSTATATVTIDVTLAGSTTSLVTSRNPEISTRPIVLTATVAPAGGVATGSVQFFDGGTLLGTAILTGSGPFTASLGTAGLNVAGSPHTVTAHYLGDANVTGSTSPAMSQTVTLGSYSVRDLGTLGGTSTLANAINGVGQVAGYSSLSGNTAAHGFLYSGGAMTDLGTLGGATSQATAINSTGQVAGFADLGDGTSHAFLYSGGTMTDLGALEAGQNSAALAMNDMGQVVGWGHYGSGWYHALLFSGGTMTDLGTFGGAFSLASAINNAGQVGGYASFPGSGVEQQDAFLYSGGTLKDLGTLGGTYIYVSGVNGAGQVAGYGLVSGNTAQHSFLYSGGAMTDLGTLGGPTSVASSINSAGQVVGSAMLSDGTFHGYLYSGGVLTDLGTIGGGSSDARSINDAGQVAVGVALAAGSPSGTSHAFLYAAGTTTDLDALLPGSFSSQLPVINNVGQVVLNSSNDGGVTSRVFLLTPAAVASLAVPSASGFVNGSVTLSATLTSSGTPLAGETVFFTLNGVAVGSGLTNVGGVATVSASLAGFSAGTYPGAIQARFLGDATYATSFGAADLLVQALMTTTTTLASSPNPSVFGQAVTFTATVVGSTGTPTGTVTFQDGTNAPGAATLDASGQASISVSSLAVGSHSVTATYNGDATFASNTSPILTQTVNQASTTLTLVSNRPTALTTQPAIFTATVSVVGPGSGAPTGQVQFFDGGTPMGTAPVFLKNGSYVAVYGGASLTVAGSPHSITAQYLGDANFQGSASSSAITQVVKPGTYFAIDLGTLGGTSSFAFGVNDTGQVFGQSNTAGDAAQHAFLYSGGTMTDLGTLGGTYSYALGVNDAGQVAGYANTTGDSAQHAFLYSGGTMTDLGTLGGTNSGAQGVNDAGQVAGLAYTTGNTAYHAFLYGNGTMTDLGTLGGAYSYALGVNDAGQVAGWAETTGIAAQHAFLYSSGTMTDLGTLGGTYSYALGVNDAGQVAGYANTAGDAAYHAILYSGGTMTDLGTLGGTYSQAQVLNDAGQVAGYANTAGDAAQHAFLYSGGTMTDLGTLGGTYSYAPGVNDAGQVAGYANMAGDAAAHAFVYSGGTMMDLRTLGGTNSGARGVNDAGQVAGYANTAGNTGYHATLWTPVPVSSLVVGSASGFSGGTVALSATLTSEGLPVSGKTVSFMLNGNAVGSAVTDASGVATLTGVSLAGIAPGSYPGGIVGSFSGDPSLGASSAAADLLVQASVATTTLTSSPNPSVFGQAVTFTASVVGSVGTPTGTVTFQDGATTLGAATLDTSGQVSISVSSLAVGSHSVTAVYSGDATFAGGSTTLAQTVNQASTTLTLVSNRPTALTTQPAIFTATLAVVGPGSGAPTGQVQFFDGGTLMGTAPVFLKNGSYVAVYGGASLTVAGSPHSITAQYLGDTNFQGSASPSAITQVVKPGTYFAIDLGTLGGTYSNAQGVNDVGQVVGQSNTAGDAAQHAFLYSGGTMTDLGTLGGTSSYVQGVNDAGQVVGAASTMGNTASHAFLYSGGTMADLGTFGGTYSVAYRVNDAGQVAGNANTMGDAASHAFLYSGGTMTDLGTFGGTSSYANAVNDAGQVAGNADTTGNAAQHAFLYSGGTITDLGTLGGTSSYAQGVNDAGQVVGYANTAGNAQHAFVYSGGTMTDLGTLGGTFSIALGVNDAGQVAGNANTTGNAAQHAFLYTGGTMMDLGTLGGAYSFAQGVNDAGQVAGRAYTTGNAAQHAFLYTGGTMMDLGTLGGTNSNALGVNDAGQVAGVAYTATAYHATLWTPVPLSNLVVGSASGFSGGTVALSATLTSSGLPVSGKTVSFALNGNAVGSAVTDVSGVATLPGVSLAGIAAGSYPGGVVASFSGDPSLGASSAAADLLVQATTSTTLTSSPNPSVFGQAVTFAATVVGSVGTPTGTVTFVDGTAATLGTAALDALGQASLTVSTLAVGSHIVSAVYSGDASLPGSTSAPLTQTVNQASTTLTLVSNRPIALATQPAIFTATVSVVGPGSGAPTGQVQFFDGGTLIGAAPVFLRNGSYVAVYGGASLTLAGSPHTVTAQYSGDANVTGSASAAVSQTVTPGSYSVRDLGNLGGTYTQPNAINDVGQVVGTSYLSGSGGNHAFLYGGGTMTDLGTLGGKFSDPLAINSTGQVVGVSTLSGNSPSHAFLYSGGAMADLGTLGGATLSSAGAAINSAGQVVGYSYASGGQVHAFLYSSGTMTDLGTLGGTSSSAAAINDGGQVAGDSNLSGDTISHAFLYSGGTMKDLMTLGGSSSSATAINSAGQVVGYANLSGNAAQHGFLYSGGTMTDLGTLGGTSSYASAINGAGQVVGFATLSGDTVNHAFLYSVGTMTDLGTLGGTGSVANAINGAGQVVGSSNLSGDAASHAFLLSGGTMTDLDALLPGPFVFFNPPVLNDVGQVVVNSTADNGRTSHAFLLTPGAVTSLLAAPASGVDVNGHLLAPVTLTATLSSGGSPVAGELVTFALNGAAMGSATTNAAGLATLTVTVTDGLLPSPGTYPIQARFLGDPTAQLATSVGTSIFTAQTDTTPPTVVLVTPNGGERVFASTPYVIQWSATDLAGVTSQSVTFSSNGGSTFSTVPGCGALPGTAGTCTWAAPGPVTAQGRIRVTATDTAGLTASATSAANFRVVAGTASVTLTAPNTAVTWRIANSQNITFNHTLGVGQKVIIDVSRDGGATWATVNPAFVTTSATTGSFAWTVTGPPTAAARARVTWFGNAAVTSMSSVNFTIVDRISITAPNTAVSWAVGSTHSISWNHNLGTSQSVNIDLSRDGGATWTSIATNVANGGATTGTYSWTVTAPATTTALVRISWAANPTVSSVSAVPFTISGTISVTAPPGGNTWGIGSRRTIAWNHTLGAGQLFNILLSTDGGTTFPTTIASGLAGGAASGSYAWVVSGPASTTARVRVVWAASAAVRSTTSNFTMAAPVITVTAPNTAVTWVHGTTHAIAWTHNLGTQESVNIDESTNGGATWSPIAAGIPNSANSSGTFNWLVTLPASTTARIRVSWTSNATVSGQSAVNFTIQ